MTDKNSKCNGSYVDVLLCFESLLENCLKTLETKQLIKDSTEVWDDFVDIILSFTPLNLVKERFQNGNISKQRIIAIMQGILDHNPDIDFTVDANYMSDNLCARYADDDFVLRCKTNIIINFRIIQAFFELLDEEYGTAFFSFRWILQFISVSKNKRHSEKRSDLSSSRTTWIIRQTSLYLAKCLNLDFNQGKRVKYVSFNSVRVNRLDMFKGILYTILENSSSVISAQQDIQNKHMTAEYFKICAEIYEFIALLDGKVLDYEHAHDVKTTVIIPQAVFSTYMIRHYMLAAVHFPFDDPNRLVCFHKILMGLFFVNKVDLATFNYFYGEFYQCAKSINEQHFVTDYANFSLSGTFVNIIESVAQNHQHLKLLPSVLIRLSTNEVIVDSEFDPVSSNRHTYSKEAEKLKRKVLGSDYERDNVEMGESGTNNFIEFWRQLNER